MSKRKMAYNAHPTRTPTELMKVFRTSAPTGARLTSVASARPLAFFIPWHRTEFAPFLALYKGSGVTDCSNTKQRALTTFFGSGRGCFHLYICSVKVGVTKY